MKKFVFNKEAIIEALSTLEFVKGTEQYSFIALKPTVMEPEEGKKFQSMKFTACNLNMQIDSYAGCEYFEDEKPSFSAEATFLLPRRFLDTCKCINGEKIALALDETSASLLDEEGNKIPFSLLNPENSLLLIPDITEEKEPEQHVLNRPADLFFQVETGKFVDALQKFGTITGKDGDQYTLDGVGCTIDEDISSLVLTSSNGHVFRKGAITYDAYVNEKKEAEDFVIPYEMITFLKAADIYENSSTKVKLVGGTILLVNVVNTTAYFRLKKVKYAPATGFDKILSFPTVTSCKVDAGELLNKLKLLEVSASSSELVENVLGVELQISGQELCVRNPKSPKTLLKIKAEDCSGEGKVYLNGTELGKLLPREDTYTIEFCGVSENTLLKVNGYHVVMPLQGE